MANLNDYKIVAQKSKKYFELVTTELSYTKKLEQKQEERFGFYLFVLENLTNLKDTSELINIITDTDFNGEFFNDRSDDCGVDAVYIDEEENVIKLFNFKYREKFKTGKHVLNETIISSKFVNAVQSQNTDSLSGKIKAQINDVVEKLLGSEMWRMQLFVVSNEDISITKDDHVKRLEEIYGLEVNIIGLSEVINFISLRPEDVGAELILDNDAVMSFTENTLSSSKSYIIRLPLSEIIRITCDNKEMRSKYSIEDITELTSVYLNYSVLFDNVRGFVKNSKFNDNILKTLKGDPTRFFIYNNGITAIVQDIIVTPTNGNKKVKIELKSLQILNGGQTLRSIHEFNKMDSHNIEKYLSEAQVLVRIFKVSSDLDLTNNIAEFTNSQNSISNVDLKSLRSEQLQLEQYLEDHDIIYVRKSGDTGNNDKKSYKYRISMEKFGQILLSIKGFPEKSTNQKKSIFDKSYDNIFGKDLIIEKAPEYIEKYHNIKKEYESSSFKSSDQKLFYILYINERVAMNIAEMINKFENVIISYKPDNNTSEARKLIQIKFKEFLDGEFNISN